MLVHHVGNRAVFGSNPLAEAPNAEHMSRSASEPDSASLRFLEIGQPSREGEARRCQASNERMHLVELPGWLGTARVDRSVEEPERPVSPRVMSSTGRGKT